MKPDLKASMMTFGSTAVASTDPVFDHALCLVGFDRHCSPDHPVFKCLSEGGYDTFYHLFYLNSEEIKDLSYFNTSVYPPTWTTLNRGDQAALLTLVAYQRYFKGTHGISLTPNDWLKITVDTINGFILSGTRDLYVDDIGKPKQPGSHLPGTQYQYSTLRAKNDCKTSQRDPCQFRPLDDEHQWVSWYPQFAATAHPQNLQDIIDPMYIPHTTGEAAVFQAKQEYLYDVFVQNLCTEKGRAYVSHYAHTRNAQAVFKELLEHHAKSSCAETLEDFSNKYTVKDGDSKVVHAMAYDGYFLHNPAGSLYSDPGPSNCVPHDQMMLNIDHVGWDPSILHGEEFTPTCTTIHQVAFLEGSSWDSPTFDGEYMCTGQEEFPMSSPTGDNCITLKASSSNCFKGTKVVNVQVLAGPCSIHTRKLPDEHLVVGFFLDDGNPGDHPMHIRMTFNIEEPPGTRPPPEPPPMTLMHPSYNDHVDDPIHPNSRLFDGELSSRVLPESMIPPDHIDYGDILIYGETMDHINKDSSNSNQVMKDHPCLRITLTTKDICNLEYGWGESLYGKVGAFCMEDAERTTKCCKCHCWHHNRRFVCTRVKMYNTPNWGGGGTCLTCEGTAEE